jgi:hypothetical protein
MYHYYLHKLTNPLKLIVHAVDLTQQLQLPKTSHLVANEQKEHPLALLPHAVKPFKFSRSQNGQVRLKVGVCVCVEISLSDVFSYSHSLFLSLFRLCCCCFLQGELYYLPFVNAAETNKIATHKTFKRGQKSPSVVDQQQQLVAMEDEEEEEEEEEKDTSSKKLSKHKHDRKTPIEYWKEKALTKYPLFFVVWNGRVAHQESLDMP